MQLELMMARTKGVSNRSEVLSSCRWVPNGSPVIYPCRYPHPSLIFSQWFLIWNRATLDVERYGSELAICVIKYDLKHMDKACGLVFNCPPNCAGYSQRCKSSMGSLLRAGEPKVKRLRINKFAKFNPKSWRYVFLTEDRYNWGKTLRVLWMCLKNAWNSEK